MSRHVVHVTTDGSGAFSWEQSLFASVRAVVVDLGTLVAPDIDITDGTYGTEVLTLTDATTDVYPIDPPVAVAGTLRIDVTDGGATKAGRIRFLLET